MSGGAKVKDILADPDKYDPAVVEVARWLESHLGKEVDAEVRREIAEMDEEEAS